MTRWSLVLPDLLHEPAPVATPWAKHGTRTSRIAPADPAHLPFFAFGLTPEQVPSAEGPLRVAALGLEPPPRTVTGCLTWATLEEYGIVQLGNPPTPAEVDELVAHLPRLESKSVRLIRGEGLEHIWAWEGGSLDLHLVPLQAAAGHPYLACRPEGDGEEMLRALIEDSVDLLSGLNLNRRRLGEGIQPLNLLWPWGAGGALTLPNLALRVGEVPVFAGTGLPLRGLARLCGARWVDLGHPLRPQWSALPADAPWVTVYLDSFSRSRAAERHEWAEEQWHLIRERVLIPFQDRPCPLPRRITIASPSCEGPGLLQTWESHVNGGDGVPWNERAIHDERLALSGLWELVLHSWASASSS